jgi:hypothetical protein
MIHNSTTFLILSPSDSRIIVNKVSLDNATWHFQAKDLLFVRHFFYKMCDRSIVENM